MFFERPQAVLKGVGVGDDSATPLAATITWLLRHGAGMIGQILFTWAEGSGETINRLGFSFQSTCATGG